MVLIWLGIGKSLFVSSLTSAAASAIIGAVVIQFVCFGWQRHGTISANTLVMPFTPSLLVSGAGLMVILSSRFGGRLISGPSPGWVETSGSLEGAQARAHHLPWPASFPPARWLRLKRPLQMLPGGGPLCLSAHKERVVSSWLLRFPLPALPFSPLLLVQPLAPRSAASARVPLSRRRPATSSPTTRTNC